MFSDDTEHTLMVAAALHRHGNDVMAFQRALAWSLRWWMLALPAGVGMSTAKAILRLWIGFPVSRSGVRSAGNGAAMRSAIIGVVFSQDKEKRQAFALAACRLTHTDERAEESALLVAEAAAMAATGMESKDIIAALSPLVKSSEMTIRWEKLRTGLDEGMGIQAYADTIGCGDGVSGFAPNTVAVALFACMRHRGDFRRIIPEVVACGGDTDTVAAIAGGICGAEVGEGGIPPEWVQGICEGANGNSCSILGYKWNTGVPPVLAGGHPDRCKLLLAGRQQPSTAGTAVFRSMNMRSHPFVIGPRR
jgi:ADP-ribosylglycohydrolase